MGTAPKQTDKNQSRYPPGAGGEEFSGIGIQGPEMPPSTPNLHLDAPRPAGAPEAPILVVGNKRDRQRLRFGPRRALATLVRRGWRCGYLECSAKYNWHVLRLFRELLRCALVRARPAHPALRLQGALHPARCVLM